MALKQIYKKWRTRSNFFRELSFLISRNSGNYWYAVYKKLHNSLKIFLGWEQSTLFWKNNFEISRNHFQFSSKEKKLTKCVDKFRLFFPIKVRQRRWLTQVYLRYYRVTISLKIKFFRIKIHWFYIFFFQIGLSKINS